MSRLGSLMPWRGECGHDFVVYSLEPTPQLCPDCADGARTVLADVVKDICRAESDLEASDAPGEEGLDEWLDEFGVSEPNLRADIRRLAGMVDEARSQMWQAAREGRKMLEGYPAAERLRMPEVT